MRVSRPLLTSACALLALLGASCASGSAMDEGDALFRQGRYQQALAVYEKHGDADDDSTAGQRIRRTRHFVLEAHARDLLHQDRPDEAMEVLEHMREVPPDREAEVAELRERSRTRQARHATREAQLALEDDRPEDAVALARRALSLDPEVRYAEAVLGHAQDQIAEDAASAEAAYLDGLEEMRQGYPLRARSAFLSALRRAPEDPRAQMRLEAVTHDLAAELRAQGRIFRESGRLGQAWVALRDAVRLEPANAVGVQQLAEIELLVEARGMLDEAEQAARAGRTDEVDRILGELDALGVTFGEGRAREVAETARETRNHEDYVRARAYELDNQSIHALGRYQAILKRQDKQGWEDVELRAAALERRISQAADAYNAALAAQRSGDAAGYRDGLEKVLRLAADYGDAMKRYRDLLGIEEPAVEAVGGDAEAGPDGGDEGI